MEGWAVGADTNSDAGLPTQSSLEAVMEGYKAQIRSLGEDLERQKALNTEIETRYDKEQRLMLSAWQEVGMQNMRSQVLAHGQQARIAPASWLAQQRARAGGGALVSSVVGARYVYSPRRDWLKSVPLRPSSATMCFRQR